MKLQDAIPGRRVVYTPSSENKHHQRKEGIITSANDKYVFVRYRGDGHSKATNPEDIEYIATLQQAQQQGEGEQG